ncbi:MAG: hypothetical protein AMXMBFR61_21850 [Fimbriimonadales bacterium]
MAASVSGNVVSRAVALTWFCPYCWREVSEDDVGCPHCNANLRTHLDLPYQQKLVLALKHPLAQTRMTVIRLLGELGAKDAVPALAERFSETSDYYELRAILTAAHKIEGDEAAALIRGALDHPSALVRRVAQALLEGE